MRGPAKSRRGKHLVEGNSLSWLDFPIEIEIKGFKNGHLRKLQLLAQKLGCLFAAMLQKLNFAQASVVRSGTERPCSPYRAAANGTHRTGTNDAEWGRSNDRSRSV